MRFIGVIVAVSLLVGLSMGASGECPGTNVITAMMSGMASFLEVSPLDFSTIRSSGALSTRNGTRIQVCLSNANFTIEQMSSDYLVPITSGDQFIAVIKFTNGREPVVAGEYSAAAGYGKPFWAYAEVKLYNGEKGVIVSLGVQEGTAVIQELTEDRICGTFNLKTKAGNPKPAEISGEFNVQLEHSR